MYAHSSRVMRGGDVLASSDGCCRMEELGRAPALARPPADVVDRYVIVRHPQADACTGASSGRKCGRTSLREYRLEWHRRWWPTAQAVRLGARSPWTLGGSAGVSGSAAPATNYRRLALRYRNAQFQNCAGFVEDVLPLLRNHTMPKLAAPGHAGRVHAAHRPSRRSMPRSMRAVFGVCGAIAPEILLFYSKRFTAPGITFSLVQYVLATILYLSLSALVAAIFPYRGRPTPWKAFVVGVALPVIISAAAALKSGYNVAPRGGTVEGDFLQLIALW